MKFDGGTWKHTDRRPKNMIPPTAVLLAFLIAAQACIVVNAGRPFPTTAASWPKLNECVPVTEEPVHDASSRTTRVVVTCVETDGYDDPPTVTIDVQWNSEEKEEEALVLARLFVQALERQPDFLYTESLHVRIEPVGDEYSHHSDEHAHVRASRAFVRQYMNPSPEADAKNMKVLNLLLLQATGGSERCEEWQAPKTVPRRYV